MSDLKWNASFIFFYPNCLIFVSYCFPSKIAPRRSNQIVRPRLGDVIEKIIGIFLYLFFFGFIAATRYCCNRDMRAIESERIF
jgi:hypothetical protein